MRRTIKIYLLLKHFSVKIAFPSSLLLLFGIRGILYKLLFEGKKRWYLDDLIDDVNIFSSSYAIHFNCCFFFNCLIVVAFKRLHAICFLLLSTDCFYICDSVALFHKFRRNSIHGQINRVDSMSGLIMVLRNHLYTDHRLRNMSNVHKKSWIVSAD